MTKSPAAISDVWVRINKNNTNSACGLFFGVSHQDNYLQYGYKV